MVLEHELTPLWNELEDGQNMSKPIIFCLRGEHPAIPAMLRRRFESSHWDRSKLGHPMGWFDRAWSPRNCSESLGLASILDPYPFCLDQKSSTLWHSWVLLEIDVLYDTGIGNETKDFGDSPIHPNWLLKILPQNQFCVSMGNLPCFSCLACHD
jgi:hypothetical protein